jgi:hypothetical protein
VTLYELYKLTIEAEDRETADHRIELLKRDFMWVPPNGAWGRARPEGAQNIPMPKMRLDMQPAFERRNEPPKDAG